MTPEQAKSWDFYSAWGMTREEFEKVCDEGVDAGVIFCDGDGLTRPGFFDAIKATKEMGHTNVIVTHRFQGSPGRAQDNTFGWLEPILEYVDEVHFSHDKTIGRCDTFVEDNLGNYDALCEVGTAAVLVNRPWNAPYNDHRLRFEDISHYPGFVEQVSKRYLSVV